MTSEFTLTRIDKQRFRPAAEVEDVLDDLRRNLVSGEKYRVARLAISRSLADQEEITPLPRGTEMGNSIEGQTLFGDDTAVWACLVVEGSTKLIATIEEFRALVEAHWTRGARLLQRDLENADMRSSEFITGLAAMARQSFGTNGSAVARVRQRSGAVSVKVGEISKNVKTQDDIAVTLNAPGVSPHIAVLGKTRSGKTRTGIVMAEQILAESELPLLLIDPKGEFVREGELVKKTEWGGKTLADRFQGIQALDVPRQVIPLDFLHKSPGAQPVDIAQAAMSFRDSFQKCLRAKGDVALDSFREIVQDLLTMARGPVSLAAIRDAVRDANEVSGRGKDTIEAKLNELCTLQLFEPTMAPAQFFNQRWAIGLSDATEESRRLVIFLLLDSLAKHLLGMRDSDTDGLGYRALRHVLVIDEAKEILSYRHNALGNLVRKSAAKGGSVMLLSQSPDDFEQEDEDFLAQIGSVVVFSSSTNSVKNLRAAFGRRLAPENFSDKELPRGVAWAKLPNTELTKVSAWE